MAHAHAHEDVLPRHAPTDPAPAAPPELRGPFGSRALRLGRLFGIDVGVDWTWIFIFGLITLSLAKGFEAGQEGWTSVQAWSAGILASLLFFASILLHELGHSLVSQSLGLPVRSITLFIFGGIASLSGEPKRPRDEFLIAAAGPLVSVLLGVGFLAVAAVTRSAEGMAGTLPVVCGWLGTVNLVLAAFNVVPGFPLDGGRLMRALVWRVTGSFERATYVASGIGAAFAYLMIGSGIVIAFLLHGFVNGLWLAFIGWFLLSAAQGSALQVTLERELRRIPLAPAIAPLSPMVQGGATVAQVLEEVVLGTGNRHFFVEEGGEPAGMVTLHQLKHVPHGERATTPVRAIQIGRDRLITLPRSGSLWEAFRLMNERGINQLPIEEDGRLVGVLTRERLVAIIHNIRELGSR